MTEGLYIGLISGTSADGVDTALVEIGDSNQVRLVQAFKRDYTEELKDGLHKLVYDPPREELQLAMEIDHALGEFFADCILDLLRESGTDAGDIIAIGSHGQTLRHYPDGPHPATLQVGDPNIIARRTGIQVIADFRRADMAAGGQGAPLMPAFHAALLAGELRDIVVINAGGIANVSILEGGRLVRGFDTGPANTLMDQWIHRHRGEPFDADGAWAAGGVVIDSLLDTLLADDWFDRPAPKSTGQEYFNLTWVERLAGDIDSFDPGDVQATLLALSCQTITDATRRYLPGVEEAVVCGGGAFNSAFMTGLSVEMETARVTSTADYGIDPDWIEAAGFGWLAYRRLAGLPGNAPAVTGASDEVLLGGLWPAPEND